MRCKYTSFGFSLDFEIRGFDKVFYYIQALTYIL